MEGEGSFHLNGTKIDGTFRRVAEKRDGVWWDTLERQDITNALVPGTNMLEMDYWRFGVPYICSPSLQVRIWVDGELVVDRRSSSEDCDFEWYWTIDGDTGAIEQIDNGDGWELD